MASHTAPPGQKPRPTPHNMRRSWWRNPWLLFVPGGLAVAGAVVGFVVVGPGPNHPVTHQATVTVPVGHPPTASATPVPASSPPPVSEALAQPVMVYSVTSDAPLVSVVYTTADHGQVVADNQTAPFSRSFTSIHPGVYGVTAEIAPGSKLGTTISCSISIHGAVMAQHTSTGHPGSSVSCITAATP